MNLKQLILSVGMLVFVGGVVASGTGAFFSDTETSGTNVFTAGSVSIDLLEIEHDYYGDETSIPVNYFTTSTNGNVPTFAFGDLKPGDTGLITSTLVNGANDAFFCARTTIAETDSPFEDLLMFRVNGGAGLTAAQTFAPAVLGQWFSLDAADAANPAGGALEVNANANAELELEYCMGTFVPGQTGVNGCNVQNPGDPATWNAAQDQSVTISTEYYAVQQRNNEGFTCGSLNTPVQVPPVVTTGTGFSPVDIDGKEWFAKARNNNNNFEVAVGTNDAGPEQDTEEGVWLAGVDYAFSLTYDGAGNATWVAGPYSTTYAVGLDSYSDVGITVKAPAGATTAVSNVVLSAGVIVPNSVSATGGTQHLTVSGANLTSAWTLTGIFNFSAVGTGTGFSQENPAVQISVN